MNYICFDLEGPLSPEDNAYNLMRQFNMGGLLFEVISRYDDILTLEGRPNYEPGDTLALIVPFLIFHGVTQNHIIELANKATLTGGAKELIDYLNKNDWHVFCISTSYRQYATVIAQKLSININNLACTEFPIEMIASNFTKEDFIYIEKIENKIANQKYIHDEWIKSHLDNFYWQQLPETRFGNVLDLIKPVGGQRKVNALNIFAKNYNKTFSDFVVIGDSITDYKMLKVVNEQGGLSIAFNGNEYVLPHATIGLASENIIDLQPMLDMWRISGRENIKEWIYKNYSNNMDGNRNNFKYLNGEKDLVDYLNVHKRIRSMVREEAAKLG